MKAKRQRAPGFTAVELLVVVTTIAIFSALAYPSFVSTVRNTRLSTTLNTLTSDLAVARREAIKRNTRVFLCLIGTTAGQCGTDVSTWGLGWQVCYDLANNSTGVIGYDQLCDVNTTTDPNPIIQRGRLDASLALTYPAARVIFNGNGTRGVSGTTTFDLRGTWSGSPIYNVQLPTSGNIVVVCKNSAGTVVECKP